MKLKSFQREDLARAALVDGLILGWDTGLGKTWAMFLWPLLKVGLARCADPIQSGTVQRPVPTTINAPVLIVAPGDLHDQIIEEAFKQFRIPVVVLDSQSTFQKLCQGHDPLTRRPILPAGFYITSYTQLGMNGVRDWPDPDKWDGHALRAWLCQPMAELHKYFDRRGIWAKEAYASLKATPSLTLDAVDASFMKELRHVRTLPHVDPEYVKVKEREFEGALALLKCLHCDKENPHHDDLATWQQEWLLRRFIKGKLDEWRVGDGEFKTYEHAGQSIPVKCCYSPTLADLAWNAFDCVVIDEGVKIKGDDTHISHGVRTMDPKYRLVLTATPIKNRLVDLFWLACWATGNRATANARFPYENTTEDKADFAKTFHVSERNLSKEEKSEAAGKGRAFLKLTPQVCNVHRLWKFLSGIIVRRRKQDCGEDIVPMHRHVLRVPMGKAQAAVVKYHLDADYRDRNGLPAIGAQLQALRIAAAEPTSTLLVSVPGAEGGPARCADGFNPKHAAALKLIAQILARGEQVAVFSAFHDPLDRLSGALRTAAVPHLTLDGRLSPTKRGQLSASFKAGTIPVVLAGVESMAEGHNWFRCSNIILIAYSWAFDKFLQAISRVHRLNSPGPVNLYAIVCDGTIDRRLEDGVKEKGDAAELVLDGKLLTEAPEELNLAELLRAAQREFSDAKTVDETVLKREEWWSIKGTLEDGARGWKLRTGAATTDVLPIQTESVATARLDVRFASDTGGPVPIRLPALVPVLPWRRRFMQMELAVA